MTHLAAIAVLFAVTAAAAPAPNEAQELPTRIFLGVDCDRPLVVSLPDDMLTECEDELMGR